MDKFWIENLKRGPLVFVLTKLVFGWKVSCHNGVILGHMGLFLVIGGKISTNVKKSESELKKNPLILTKIIKNN